MAAHPRCPRPQQQLRFTSVTGVRIISRLRLGLLLLPLLWMLVILWNQYPYAQTQKEDNMNRLDQLGKAFTLRNGYNSSTGSVYSVRLQDYVDDDVPPDCGISSMWEKIKGAKDQLAHAARSSTTMSRDIKVSLYPRFWKEVEPDTMNRGSTSVPTSTFTVVTFNTLARGLSSGPIPTPFAKSNHKPDAIYGGFTEVQSPEVTLDFNIRKWRLLEVLLGGGLKEIAEDDDVISKPAFDILALEEVDEYNSFFHPALVKDGNLVGKSFASTTLEDKQCLQGYQGVFQPKLNSPCIPLGWYSDGVSLLWNSDKFQTIPQPSGLEDDDGISKDTAFWVDKGSFGMLDTSGNRTNVDASTGTAHHNQVYIIVPLQIRGSDKCVVVAATHLKAKKGPINNQTRLDQAMELRYRAEKVANDLMKNGREDVSILILGDFNSEPTDSSVKCILSQEECSSNKNPLWKFQSAYPIHESSQNSIFTTWKTRKDGTVRRIIDYIFHASYLTNSEEDDKGLRCTHILSVPDDGEMEKGRLPGLRYPSDHLLIAAKFQY